MSAWGDAGLRYVGRDLQDVTRACPVERKPVVTAKKCNTARINCNSSGPNQYKIAQIVQLDSPVCTQFVRLGFAGAQNKAESALVALVRVLPGFFEGGTPR